MSIRVAVNVGFADDDNDDATERPIGDFLERQGAFCIRFDFMEFAYVDTRDDFCPFDEFLFVPPVDNFIAWNDPETLLGISSDYAGLSDDALGGSLGTEFEGEFIGDGEKTKIPKIQWVSQKTAHEIKMIIPKALFNGEEFNEESLEEVDVYTEPHYLQLKEGEEIQFVRFGYCRKDSQNQAIFTHK